MGEQQQMARVDVDLETWQTFRIEAIRRGRSIADWLGELVEREVARIESASAKKKGSDTASTGSASRAAAPTPKVEADENPRQRPARKTVAGQPLLTELPHGGSKPPPWEL